MQKARRIVGQDQAVADPRPPPKVFGGKTDGDVFGIKAEAGLAGKDLADGSFTKAVKIVNLISGVEIVPGPVVGVGRIGLEAGGIAVGGNNQFRLQLQAETLPLQKGAQGKSLLQSYSRIERAIVVAHGQIGIGLQGIAGLVEAGRWFRFFCIGPVQYFVPKLGGGTKGKGTGRGVEGIL